MKLVLQSLLIFFILFLYSCQTFNKSQTIDTKINLKSQDDFVVETIPLMNNGVKNLYNLAKNDYINNNFVQAILLLERAYNIQPNSPPVTQLLAEINLHKGNFKQAYYWANIATKNGPTKGRECEKSWRILAIAAEQLGYYTNQAKALKKKDTCIMKEAKRF